MLFCPPFVRENLIQIPGQNSPENNIKTNAYNSCGNGVLVDHISKIEHSFDGLGVDHFLEGEDKSNMRHYGNSSVDSLSGVGVAGDDVVDDVLQHEEKKSEHDAYFGTSYKYLNEEALHDEQDIEQDENN